MRVARPIVLLAAMVAAGCTRAMFVPPAGPGVPMAGAQEAWAEATTRCRTATSYSATLRLSGRAGDQRIPTLTVEAAVTNTQDVYLGATAAGRPIFVLAGAGGRGALWLRREHRVVADTAEAIIEALSGVKIGPDRLLAVLAGCVTKDTAIHATSRHDRLLRVETPDAVVYLEHRNGAWQTRAGEADGLVIEYERATSSLPARIWIWARPSGLPPAHLNIALVEGEINGSVPRQFFELPAGASTAEPMSLEELRAAGAWRAGTEGGR